MPHDLSAPGQCADWLCRAAFQRGNWSELLGRDNKVGCSGGWLGRTSIAAMGSIGPFILKGLPGPRHIMPWYVSCLFYLAGARDGFPCHDVTSRHASRSGNHSPRPGRRSLQQLFWWVQAVDRRPTFTRPRLDSTTHLSQMPSHKICWAFGTQT